MRVRASLLPLAVLLVVSCGGGDGAAGRTTFQRAERALAHVEAARAHLVVHALVSVDRSVTIERSELPFERLRLSRWAKRPRPIACGHGFECARAVLDVDAALDELEPVLPPLPLRPSSLESATIEVALDSRGRLLRVDLRGHAYGARVDAELRPLR